jgi:hypothetical protein
MRVRHATVGVLAILAGVLAPGAARAQVVQGRITDEMGERPLAAAEVSLLDEEGRPVAVTLSDSAGWYRIGPREPGIYSVQVDLLGYQRLVTPLLALEGERTVNADFEVPAAPIELEGLRVEAEALERLRQEVREFGVDLDNIGERFVGRAAIEQRTAARDFGHVLQWQSVPGLTVTRSDDTPTYLQPLNSWICVRVARSRGDCAIFALNGTLITPEAAALVPPETLEAIVVLTPVEAAQTFGTDAAAGAVLLYTRRH